MTSVATSTLFSLVSPLVDGWGVRIRRLVPHIESDRAQSHRALGSLIATNTASKRPSGQGM